MVETARTRLKREFVQLAAVVEKKGAVLPAGAGWRMTGLSLKWKKPGPVIGRIYHGVFVK